MNPAPLDLPVVLYLTNAATDRAGLGPITLTWDGSAWIGRAILLPPPIRHGDE